MAGDTGEHTFQEAGLAVAEHIAATSSIFDVDGAIGCCIAKSIQMEHAEAAGLGFIERRSYARGFFAGLCSGFITSAYLTMGPRQHDDDSADESILRSLGAG